MGLGSEIRDQEKAYSGSWIQGSKEHRIPDPDPQHCLQVEDWHGLQRCQELPLYVRGGWVFNLAMSDNYFYRVQRCERGFTQALYSCVQPEAALQKSKMQVQGTRFPCNITCLIAHIL
jgi:hypothetical protein